MNKTQATKKMREVARWGHFAYGSMMALLRCPECKLDVVGYRPEYARTYDNGVTFKDRMVTHLMEEH